MSNTETHIFAHPKGHSASAYIGGERVYLMSGHRYAFGPEALNDRTRERVGEYLITIEEYEERRRQGKIADGTIIVPRAAEQPVRTGPEWAHMTIAELVGDHGWEALSKTGLTAVCTRAGIDANGTTSELRGALSDTLEGGDEDDESSVASDGDAFAHLDTLDILDDA